jgi:hypothetical protein
MIKLKEEQLEKFAKRSAIIQNEFMEIFCDYFVEIGIFEPEDKKEVLREMKGATLEGAKLGLQEIMDENYVARTFKIVTLNQTNPLNFISNPVTREEFNQTREGFINGMVKTITEKGFPADLLDVVITRIRMVNFDPSNYYKY